MTDKLHDFTVAELIAWMVESWRKLAIVAIVGAFLGLSLVELSEPNEKSVMIFASELPVLELAGDSQLISLIAMKNLTGNSYLSLANGLSFGHFREALQSVTNVDYIDSEVYALFLETLKVVPSNDNAQLKVELTGLDSISRKAILEKMLDSAVNAAYAEYREGMRSVARGFIANGPNPLLIGALLTSCPDMDKNLSSDDISPLFDLKTDVFKSVIASKSFTQMWSTCFSSLFDRNDGADLLFQFKKNKHFFVPPFDVMERSIGRLKAIVLGALGSVSLAIMVLIGMRRSAA